MQAWHTRVPKFEYCLSGHFQQSKRHYVDSSQLLSLSLPSRKRNSSAIPYSFLAHMVHYTRKLWSGVVQARLVYTVHPPAMSHGITFSCLTSVTKACSTFSMRSMLHSEGLTEHFQTLLGSLFDNSHFGVS